MINYLKSELYRILYRKGTYLFILICSALLVSSNVVLALVDKAEENFPYATTYFSLGNLITNFPFIFLICIGVASMIFGNEHNNHTMKNNISYGLSRGRIYFGKFIIEVIYSLIAFFIISGCHVGSAYLILEHSSPKVLEMLLDTFVVTLPLLLLSLATTNSFAFIMEGTGSAIASTIGVLLAFPLVTNFLGMKFKVFRDLASVLPWNMINNLDYDFVNFQLLQPWEGMKGYYMYWTAGMVQLIIICAIGYMVFRRKEIK